MEFSDDDADINNINNLNEISKKMPSFNSIDSSSNSDSSRLKLTIAKKDDGPVKLTHFNKSQISPQNKKNSINNNDKNQVELVMLF